MRANRLKKRSSDLPPRAIGREAEAKGLVFPGGRRDLTRAELERALTRRIAAWIEAACIWDEDALIGDYRFVIFSIDISPEIGLYVQFWSEPAEPVLWEVSSGRWNPPADKWLAGERSARIAALGFTIGGKAENFAREVDIRTREDCRRVASGVVSVLYEGFDYRGRQPIDATLVYESRAELQPTYESFTPEDVTKILEALGYRVRTDDDEEDEEASPVLRASRRGIVTQIALEERDGDQNLYARAVLLAESPMPEEVARAVRREIPEVAAGLPHLAFFRDVLHFGGGVTVEWFARRLAEWEKMLRTERGKGRGGARERGPAGRGKSDVH